MAKCLHNFSGLQSLKLDCCSLTTSGVRAIANWRASLKELSLSKCAGVTDECVSTLVQKHNQLRKLDITCCRKITYASINSITSSCSSLVSLKMESCSLVPREAYVLIGKHCPYLEELDVTDNEIDNEGCTGLLAPVLHYIFHDSFKFLTLMLLLLFRLEVCLQMFKA